MPAQDPQGGTPGKPIRAKLGEESSFVYDPELKRWVNKKGGAEITEAKKATPPPPRSMPPRSANSTPPPTTGTPPPSMGRSSAPPGAPGGPPPRSVSNLIPPDMAMHLSGGSDGPTPMMRSVSNNSTASAGGPPSRPATSMSNASSIDDLLGAAAPRKGAGRKGRKGGSRYVDVMGQ